MSREYLDVELPLIDQLRGLGWSHYINGSVEDPKVTLRQNFTEVYLEPILRKKLCEINLRDGEEWLDKERIDDTIKALQLNAKNKLIEINKQVTEDLLLKGHEVDGIEGWNGGRSQIIQFFDWQNVHNNQFTIVRQFRVDCPPGYDKGKGYIIPDIVLFVNGLPLVVIECKSPAFQEPIIQAIDQLRRYTNQRFEAGEVHDKEGNENLFITNQLLIATSFDEARVSTIGGLAEHYLPWKTTYPEKEETICEKLGVSQLSEQQRLVQGILEPKNLLDLVRHFVINQTENGRLIKIAPRYQQYRAVNKAVERLKNGDTRAIDGEHDKRDGIIWHTQGSGKSLTMVFLVRKMRSDYHLQTFKIVMVTDRKQLQKQLAATSILTGEKVYVAKDAKSVNKLIESTTPDIVFAMIQKYQDQDLKAIKADEKMALDQLTSTTKKSSRVRNANENILILIDEAHRTQAGDLHANLMAALPNAARIGFTGTPIIMGKKKYTHDIFGEFIDRYTIKEAEEDGAIVPILYEGRTAKGALKDGATLDELFEDLFAEKSKEELEEIKKKYATKGDISEAPLLIEDKAYDMLCHYVTHIMANGLKAQVVVYSRLAAIRYVEALNKAKEKLLKQSSLISEADKKISDEELVQKPLKKQALIQAYRQKDLLQKIDFAAIISADNNDDPTWKEWTDHKAQETRIENFKKPLIHSNPEKVHHLSFIIVKSMLLTGFDAPIEGVLYLDRSIQEAELLQAVARVNRTGFGKKAGLVVDYYGVAEHLKDALSQYSQTDIEGALTSIKDILPSLRDAYARVMKCFTTHGLDIYTDLNECVHLLESEKLRAEFTVKLKKMLALLDIVLPRPEGLEFVKGAKQLAYIYARARNQYQMNSTPIGKDVGAKVRQLIDDHVIGMGVDPKIPPITLLDAGFSDYLEQIEKQAGKRAKASAMQHAVRAHATQNMDKDPVKYAKLSEYVEEILKNMHEHWDEQIKAFQKIMDQELTQQTFDFEDEKQPEMSEEYKPFYNVVVDEVFKDIKLTEEQQAQICGVVHELVDMIADELTETFWESHKAATRESLKSRIVQDLFKSKLVPITKATSLANKIMDIAQANHEALLKL